MSGEEVVVPGIIFWFCGVVLVVAGAVTLGRGKTPEGVMFIVAGVLLGPVAMTLFIGPP